MAKVFFGIDNGVTGTIGIVGDDIEPKIIHTPVKNEQDFTKAKKAVSRLDCNELLDVFREYVDKYDVHVVCERPMINPARWNASMSAIRCWEAMLIILEVLKLPHQFVDSKEWQKVLLPKGIKGSDEQKKASKDIGKRLFPQLSGFKHTDFDGLLIAEYARRKNL